MKKIAHSLLTTFGTAIILLCVALAFSKVLSERGKIHASVLDAATGKQLAGATVSILESTQSAITGDSGTTVIANVSPGNHYTVSARALGYSTLIQKNIAISSGWTTELTFRMNPGADDSVITLTPGIVADASNGGASIHGKRGPSNSLHINQFGSGDVLAPSQSSNSKMIAGFGSYSGEVDYYAPPPRYAEFNTAEYSKIDENEYKDVKHYPLSTFSIDVDGASYSNIRHFITSGQAPPKDAVRIEEMVNYFRYEYPQPKNSDPFSITTELTACPWNKDHKLALIGLQGKEIPKDQAPAANLTFLIDVSGSMQPEERLPLIRRAFRLLVNEMRPQDNVAIVTYAGTPGLALPPTSGEKKNLILKALDRLEAGGSTAGGAGIELAYSVAQENFDKEKNNRVILATDGDFNVGISNTGDLVRYIEDKRATGIYLTTIGVGTDNYKDARMKQLADKGNGNYYYIDNILEAKKVFVTQMGGTLNTIAKDVKIQIEFNPSYVKGYRLIGYESRILAKEDFNNDKKDAGELGSGHTVTALYEIIPPEAAGGELHSVDSLRYQQNVASNTSYKSGEAMMVKFRYKRPSDSTSKLMEHPVTQTPGSFAEASNNLRFAAAVAEFGMLLRDSKFKAEASVQKTLTLAKQSKAEDIEGYRAEFIKLIEAYQLLDKAEK